MTEDRAAGLLGSLREGWHGLAGGDAGSCPGCPVCALTEHAGRMDPAATEHLQAAAGHLAAAGRELLAVLGGGGSSPVAPDATGGPGPAGRHPGDPDPGEAAPTGWTRIPVSTPENSEEHP